MVSVCFVSVVRRVRSVSASDSCCSASLSLRDSSSWMRFMIFAGVPSSSAGL